VSEDIEIKLLRENKELKRRLDILEGKSGDGTPIYSYR
jgi:hypothetical protein